MVEAPSTIADFDALPVPAARELVRPVVNSSAWLDVVVGGRPYDSLAPLCAASDVAVRELTWPSVQEALAAHPRIGERAGGGDVEAAWSRQEQAGAGDAGEGTATALRRGNIDYERRFGHVYLVCATGRSAEDLLADLRERLTNEPVTERDVVRRELAAIARVRLARLFAA